MLQCSTAAMTHKVEISMLKSLNDRFTVCNDGLAQQTGSSYHAHPSEQCTSFKSDEKHLQELLFLLCDSLDVFYKHSIPN